MSSLDNIRNFAIIAHIDHGKSTIADRIIHKCGGLTEREMKDQVLDSMDIERERGITIKAQTVKLNYKAKDGKEYILNIIDTPGHVDFSYEVSRSLYACEGSILIVDSTQGVEAQTLANVYQALDINHEIIPVLNKIDLPASDLDRTKKQIEDVIGIDTSNAVPCSGKTGEGIEDILESIVSSLPPPKGEIEEQLKCLLVDSWYDSYLGVIILIIEQSIIDEKPIQRCIEPRVINNIVYVAIGIVVLPSRLKIDEPLKRRPRRVISRTHNAPRKSVMALSVSRGASTIIIWPAPGSTVVRQSAIVSWSLRAPFTGVILSAAPSRSKTEH